MDHVGQPDPMHLFVRRASLLVPLAVLVAAVLVRVQLPGAVEGIRLQVFDAYQRLLPRPYVPVPVRIVDVDEASLERIGQWPWPRTVLADLVERLFRADPSVLVMDFLFPEPDRTSPRNVIATWPDTPGIARLRAEVDELPDHDRIFAAAIRAHRVVSGFVLTQRPGPSRVREKWRLEVNGQDPRPYLPGFAGVTANLPALDEAAAGTGSFNVVPEFDGNVRRLHLVFRAGDRIVPSLAAEAVRVAQGAAGYRLRAAGERGREVLGAHSGLHQILIGSLAVPTDSQGRLWLHHTRPERSRFVPAWQVLEGRFDAASLAGHVLLFGSSAPGLKDIRATPLNPVAAGVEVQAQAIEQILLGHFLERPGWADVSELAFMVLLGLSLVLLLRVLSAPWCTVLGAGVVALAVGTSWYLFAEHRLLLDPVVPSLTALVIFVAGSVTRFLQSEAERRQVRTAFNQYLAPAVIDQLLDEPDRLVLGGEKREMSFLFTDIAGFTSLTERTEPSVLVRLLNEYLEGACSVVLEHGGTIDKIVGDALHVMFNAPSRQPDHAARAVRCALDLDRFCQDFVDRQTDRGTRLGRTRIGINTGPCVVGNFGGSSRFDYTAHGDAINTAARLEGANKYLGTRICVSESTVARCPRLEFRPIGRLRLAGKGEPLAAHEPWTGDNGLASDLAAYREAYRLMEAADGGAGEAFADLAARYPGDPLVALHARRLRAGERGSEIVVEGK